MVEQVLGEFDRDRARALADRLAASLDEPGTVLVPAVLALRIFVRLVFPGRRHRDDRGSKGPPERTHLFAERAGIVVRTSESITANTIAEWWRGRTDRHLSSARRVR
jgi:hypothetical protein